MTNLSQEDWRAAIAEDKNAVVIDCRTPQEWNEGIQEGAEMMNFLAGSSFMEDINKLDKSKTYYMYCRSGNRSGQSLYVDGGQWFF